MRYGDGKGGHAMKDAVLWRAVFGMGAASLAPCLVPGSVGLLHRDAQAICHVLGAVSALVCLCAGGRLRDSERARAATNGAWLNDACCASKP